MKKAILFLSVVYLSILGAFAQSIVITDGSNTITNGDTVYVYRTPTYVDSTLDVHVYAKNVSGSAYDAKVRRTTISEATGSENSFCFGVGCYPPFVNLSQETAIANDQKMEIKGEYKAKGSLERTVVMYSAFDINNTSDSAWVFVVYYPNSAVGIHDAKDEMNVSAAYPNPANNVIHVDYEFSSQLGDVRFVISDVLGTAVKSIEVNDLQGKLSVMVDDLENGVYFYSFVTKNDILITRKLIVRH